MALFSLRALCSSTLRRGSALLAFALVGLPLSASASLALTPLAWNIVGLDSNSPATGPRHFPVGARICSNVATTNVTASFVWDSANANVNLRSGSLNTLTFPAIAANSCVDAYYEVEVNPVAAAFDSTRRYHINASDGSGSFSTVTPREVYVEHLVSQSRNAINTLRYGPVGGPLVSVPAGGSLNLVVGNTYDIELAGGTATQGYEQFEAFINFTNTIFQIVAVNTTYSADSTTHVSSPNDKLYGDACLWQNDPNSPNYRSCQDVGKIGGSSVVSLYTIRIIGGGGTQQTLNSLLYDFSGSSYHYNADFDVGARIGNIIDPATATIDKAFVPSTTSVGGISTLKITLANPNAGALPGYNFVDNLPAGMTVANPPNATTSNCGSPTFAPSAGASVLNFSNGTVAGHSSCTIAVSVTTNAVGAQAFTNTTGNLFVGTTNTGDNATAVLTVTTAPPPPACTPGIEIARWAFNPAQGTSLPPPFTSKSSRVATAVASFNQSAGQTNFVDTVTGNPVNAWSGAGWDVASVPPAAGPGPNTPNYFQFVLDTSKFQAPFGIAMQVNPTPSGKWASPSDITTNVHVQADAGPFASVINLNPTARSTWNALTGSSAVIGAATTTVRVNISGRGTGASAADAPLLLDNVVFTACGVPDHPTIAKAFSPDPIAVGGTSTLTFTLNNPNALALTGAAFTDSLPAGMSVAGTPAASTTCAAATWAPVAAATTLTFSGGTIPASGSCTVQVNVTTNVAGPSTNISGFISTTQTGTNNGPGGSATATLTALAPPQIGKEFAPSPILAGGISTVTLTIINPNQNNAMTGVAFTDNLPNTPGVMRVAAVPAGSTSGCGAPAFAPVAAATSVALSGGSISAGGTCTVRFNVTAPNIGSYTNNSGTVSHIVNGVPANGNSDADALVVNPSNPGIALLKDVGPSASGPWSNVLAVNLPGNVFYRFTIENVGDVPLTGISLTDPPGGAAVACAPALPASLPVADALDDDHIATCIVGPVTAVAGTTINTARASGMGGTPVSDEDTATYASTGLTIDKSASPVTYTAVGNVINYSFVVTNSGAATLTGPISVLDNRSIDESCPALTSIGDLDNFFDPGEQLVCTATYMIVAGDISAASVTNIATATNGTATSPSDSETVHLAGPRLTLAKSASGASFTVGLPATYTVNVTNSGTAVTTGNIVVTDTLPTGITLTGFSGSGWNCITVGTPNVSCTYSGAALGVAGTTAVTLNVNVGPGATTGNNSATTSGGGDTTCPAAARCTDTVAVTILSPVLSTVKSGVLNNTVVPPATSTEVGDQIDYTITVSNSGTGAATSVTVNDPRLPGLVCVPANGSNIPAGGSMSCTGTYTLTGSDVGAGSVSNTATATGGNVCNPTTAGSTCSDTRVTPLGVVPVLTTVKTAVLDNAVVAPNNQSNPGDTIAYSIVVGNSGNATATAVTVSDPLFPGLPGAALSCVPANGSNIAAAALMTCTGTYVLTAGDVTSGSVTNTATAGGANICNPTTVGSTCSDTVNTPLALEPVLSTSKTGALDNTIVAPNDQSNVGDRIAYTITVSNSGNGPASNVNIAESLLFPLSCTISGPPVTLPTTLNAGATLTCTGNYVLVAADVATASVTNVATTSAANVCNPSTAGSTCSDDEITPLAVFARLTTSKTGVLDNTVVPPNNQSNPGDTIAYTINVVNSGNGTALGVALDDPLLPGATCTISAVPVSLPTSLNAGATLSCSGVYALTQLDVDNGSASNIATISATNVCNPTSAGSVCADTEITPLTAAPILTTSKVGVLDNSVVAPNNQSNPGDTIAYTITVVNAGNGTASAVNVTDALPFAISCTISGPVVTLPTSLNAGATLTCTGTYLLTAGDVSAGNVTNTATTGAGNVCNPATAGSVCSDTEITPLTLVPVLTTTKLGVLDNTSVPPNDQSNAGDRISYTITVTNSGNGPATGVTVSDPRLPSLACTIAGNPTPLPTTLNAGSSLVCVGTYILLAADLTAGTVLNTATVAGGNVCNPVSAGSVCSDEEITPLAVLPILTTSKTSALNNAVVPPANESNPGDTIAYTITVANSGNGSATGVTVSDPLITLSCMIGGNPAPLPTTLNAGAALTCTGTYVLLQGDVTNGSRTNTATVSAGNVCNPATAGSVCSDTEITPLGVVPVLTTSKAGLLDNAVVAPGNQSNPGDTIAYTITVTNSGNGPATGVTVSDPRLPALDCVPAMPVASLAVGASISCTGTYVLAAADIAAGSVINTATVAGSNVCNPTTPGSTCGDTETTPLAVLPILSITKASVLDNTVVPPANASDVGDRIDYTITVLNSGNGPAGGVNVSDPSITLTCTIAGNPASLPTTLNAGASLVCTGTHVLVLADLNSGAVSNTATVSGNNVCNPTSPGSVCTDTEVTPLGQVPVLTLSKTGVLDNSIVTPADTSNPGDRIDYTLTVMNSGSAAATGVNVHDPRIATLACTIAGNPASLPITLNAGATLVCTGSYTLTALDLAAGLVSNTATVTGANVCNPTTPGSTCADTEITPLQPRPDLNVLKVHTGNFTLGQAGARYTITVSNAGPVATTAPVQLTDLLPAGLTATAFAGPGWTCVLTTLTCTRADILAAGASYPALTLTVNVALNAPPSLLNTAIVQGGGDSDPSNNSDDDPVVVIGQAVPLPLGAGWTLPLAGLLGLSACTALARRPRKAA